MGSFCVCISSGSILQLLFNLASSAVPTILLADDEPNILLLLEIELRAEGFDVCSFADGLTALKSIRESPPDLALLDWSMPGISGLDICRRMRETNLFLPVIMITARDQIDDRISALDAGADDFISKPFNVREVIARVRALLRRSKGFSPDFLSFGPLTLNCSERTCSCNEVRISLTVREFDLLECFMRHPRQVLTRAQLIQRVWGEDYFGDDNVVDVYVRYLRRKVESAGESRVIHTVRGVGFALRSDAP
jgi:DNA-binding response OmpR family regulator